MLRPDVRRPCFASPCECKKASPKLAVAVVNFDGAQFGNLLAMRFEEYLKHDAISLAGLIAKREVSAEGRDRFEPNRSIP